MSSSTDAGIVETYRITSDDLRADARAPGIGAFMRIKNGADFLEATIRSHIGHVDEIVAAQDRCSDSTPDILTRLAPQELRAAAPALIDFLTMLPMPEGARLKLDRWRRYLTDPPTEAEMAAAVPEAMRQGQPARP